MKTTTMKNPNFIGNKLKRLEVVKKLRAIKKKESRVARKERQKVRSELGDKAPPTEQPKTIESTRERDETMVPNEDTEVQEELAMDEFSSYFKGDVVPKIAITTSRKPTKKTFDFIHNLLGSFPNSAFYPRKNFDIKAIVKEAIEKDFSDLMILHEDRKKLNSLVLVHLPGGPTAHFKLSNIVLNEDIPGAGEMTSHQPEVILNNFNTRLGQRIGRMLACLFDQKPEFRGRRVATFHNQRDFVFFRQHRYIFNNEGGVVRLQELGPQFTLKLRSLQHGLFDTKHGEYEFKHRAELDTSRRRFFI